MADQQTLSHQIQQARQDLESVSETPSLDAQLLMMRVLGRPRAWLLAHPEIELNVEQQRTYDEYVQRCADGEALPYVLGWWEFFGRQFHLSPKVLIPRPETEHLVEHALSFLAKRKEPVRVLDLGTGSGCILVTIAIEMPEHQYLGSDVSWDALNIARKNLLEYRLETTVTLIQADLLVPFNGPFDLIIANLPYIPQKKLAELKVAEREPVLALDGGPDGLAPLRRMARNLASVLARGGDVLLELDPEQMEPAGEILNGVCDWQRVKVHNDLAGRARVLHASGAHGLRKLNA